ncbi:MAG: S41 family peptidase [Limnochordia bacterium]
MVHAVRRTHLSVIVGMLLLACCARVSFVHAEEALTVEQMKADLRVLINVIDDVHPALTDSATRAAFKNRAEGLMDLIEPSMSLSAFSLLAARVVNALPEADAHTMVGLVSDQWILPVRFRWLSDQLIISQVEGDTPLDRGDIVITLGGLTPDKLLEGLRTFIAAENDHWIRNRGERLISYRFMLDALGAMAEDGTVDIVARRSGDAPGTSDAELRLTLACAPLSSEAIVPPPSERPWFGWCIEPEHSLGIFWLDQCDDTEEYRAAVDAFFAAVHHAGVRKVAIDVRRNVGGDSGVTKAFLRYLPAETIRTYGSRIRFSSQANAQRGYTFLMRLMSAFSGTRSRTVNTPRPSGPNHIFSGDLYVLTSNQTASSGVWIAVVLSDNGLATVVGEPTGGAPSGYGDILSFELPETGLRFVVSHKHFIRPDATRDPADTLMPDQLIPTTAEDIRLSRDAQLEWVRAVMPH